jgi:hypothetical protein
MSVFDDLTRNDPSPAGPLESLSQFLNRAHTPYWATVRRLIEDWFTRLPEPAQADVRGRLRSKDNRQFHGAFWELYLHETLIRSGFDVECHPVIPDTPRLPDFVATRGASTMYVEARTTFEQAADPSDDKRLNQALDALNRLESPNFFIWVEVGAQGTSDLKVSPLRRMLESWLANLDPDDIIDRLQATSDIDSVAAVGWEIDGWHLIIHPVPKAVGRRGLDGTPAVGVQGPAEAAMIDNVGPLRSALSDKGGAYGALDHPFVIAIRSSSMFSDDFDVIGALFGSSLVTLTQDPNGELDPREVRAPDGYWYAGTHWAHRNVSAVLLTRGLMPWTVTSDSPELWRHPDPERPLGDVPPSWKQAIPGADTIDRHAAPAHAWELFGLPKDWPGGGPFDPYP